VSILSQFVLFALASLQKPGIKSQQPLWSVGYNYVGKLTENFLFARKKKDRQCHIKNTHKKANQTVCVRVCLIETEEQTSSHSPINPPSRVLSPIPAVCPLFPLSDALCQQQLSFRARFLRSVLFSSSPRIPSPAQL
jgi:hypothetical protein